MLPSDAPTRQSLNSGTLQFHLPFTTSWKQVNLFFSSRYPIKFLTIKALIKALLKNNYDPQRHLVWSTKNYLGPLGAPCIEGCLWIRAQLAPFQWTRKVWMATMATVEPEYAISRCHEYKHVRSPEINERHSNSWRTSSLESGNSQVQNFS